MGLLDALFGSGQTDDEPTTDGGTDDERKFAILLNAGPDDGADALNAFNYALELDAAGYEVQMYLDGEASQWPAAFAENPDRPFKRDWDRVRERGLITGACGFCANAFDVADAYDDDDLVGGDGHGPSVAELADQGYELLSV